MVSKSAMLLLALSALAAATPATVEKREACGDVHLIIARASTEAPGDGIIGSVGDDIVSGSKQTVTRES